MGEQNNIGEIGGSHIWLVLSHLLQSAREDEAPRFEGSIGFQKLRVRHTPIYYLTYIDVLATRYLGRDLFFEFFGTLGVL